MAVVSNKDRDGSIDRSSYPSRPDGGQPVDDDYAQYNPTIPNGPDAILGVLAALSPDFNYEPGMVAADGDIVMVKGRYVGWAPKPVVGVDIFRGSEGKVAEHWDVLQEEVPAELTKSERPMFTKP
ncbi:MAG: nuclear transport factor 2 family protein [Silvibacterium sp.]|jgi:predicted SnoaL-like aldol condensation-catalyzing enzyme